MKSRLIWQVSLSFTLTLLIAIQGGCSKLPWNRDQFGRAAPPVERYSEPPRAVAPQPQTPPPVPTAERADTNAARQREAAQRQREVDDLVAEALTAPQMDQRTVAALRASDRAVAGLADTITAIDQAEKIIVDNLRNANTTAYKATRPITTDKREVTLQLNMEQGSLENTSRPLDVGIEGDGFFAVKIEDTIGGGIGYTRNGNFFVNNKGELILGIGDGRRLVPPITVPAGTTEISINPDGLVETLKAGSTTRQNVGQLILCRFVNSSGLGRVNSSAFVATEASGPAVECKPGIGGAGHTVQGYLEQSNVDLNRERMRLRFLQNWRDTLVKAIDGEPRGTARPAAATELGR